MIFNGPPQPWVVSLFLLFQETKAMKKLFALTLLVAALGVVGCGQKKAATPPAKDNAAPAAAPAEKPAETPAETPAEKK